MNAEKMAIRAARFVLPDAVLEGGMLLVEGTRIAGVFPASEAAPEQGWKVLDASGLTVLPGLIDVHTHGIAGVSAVDGEEDTMERLSLAYASHGVTGFLTSVSGSLDHITAGLRTAVEAMQHPQRMRGAALLGVHLEGPFINPKQPGAFRLESILKPDADLFRRLADLGGGTIRQMTLAPELDGAAEVIRLARQRGIVCAAGHSSATYEEMQRAADAGLTHVTHTFNAMRPLHHRQPGILGAALTDERLSVELIGDGVHVHPAVMKLIAHMKGARKTVLISDSIGAAGMPDGAYQFEEQAVTLKNGAVRLADGTLAGSALTLEKSVLNMVHLAGASLAEAACMASLAPAGVLGLQESQGSLEKGKEADLTALDADGEVVWTMVSGQMVYRRS